MFKFLRSTFISGFVILALSAAFLFVIKSRVRNLSGELKGVNAKILSTREDMHVLNAEIAYLSNPKRIKALADSKLLLSAPKRGQIISIAELRTQFHSEMQRRKKEQVDNTIVNGVEQ